MPPIFTPEQIATMTPDEAKLANDMNAAEAAGRDPLVEPEQAEEEAAPVEAQAAADEPPKDEAKPEAAEPKEGEQVEAKADDKPAEEAKPDEAAAEDAADEPEESPALRLEGKPVEKYDEQRKALRSEKQAARAKWSAGEIDDAEFNRLEAEADDKLEALQEQHLTAKALAAAGEQLRIQQENVVLRDIATRAKKAGVDYADAATAGRFDRALALIEGDPSFKDKGFAERAEEAHKTVMALAGKGSQPPAAAAPAAPAVAATPAAPRQAPTPPKTLAELPAAEQANTGDTAREQLSRVKGKDAEKFWASLPKSKQDELLGERA